MVQFFGAVSCVPTGQRNTGGLGDAEVQTPCGPQDAGESPSRTHRGKEPAALCGLAERYGQRVCLMAAQ